MVKDEKDMQNEIAIQRQHENRELIIDQQDYICPDAKNMKCKPINCRHATPHGHIPHCTVDCHIRQRAGLITHQCKKCKEKL